MSVKARRTRVRTMSPAGNRAKITYHLTDRNTAILASRSSLRESRNCPLCKCNVTKHQHCRLFSHFFLDLTRGGGGNVVPKCLDSKTKLYCPDKALLP